MPRPRAEGNDQSSRTASSSSSRQKPFAFLFGFDLCAEGFSRCFPLPRPHRIALPDATSLRQRAKAHGSCPPRPAPISKARVPAPAPLLFAACSTRHLLRPFRSLVSPASFHSLISLKEEEKMSDPKYAYPYPAQGYYQGPPVMAPPQYGGAAAEEAAGFPRRLSGRALLLLLGRRVLLRPLHHLHQLEDGSGGVMAF